MPHEDFGAGVTAIISLKKNMKINIDDLRSLMKEKLAGFKIPQQFIIIDNLPKNVMGKIKKNELRETFKKIYSKGTNQKK